MVRQLLYCGVLLVLLIVGCGTAAPVPERIVVTATPRTNVTRYPETWCERPPTRYEPAVLESGTTIHFDVSTLVIEDELLIRYQDEVIFQCQYIVTDEDFGAGYLFKLPVDEGEEVRLIFENRAKDVQEALVLEPTADQYVHAQFVFYGSEGYGWAIRVSEEPTYYE